MFVAGLTIVSCGTLDINDLNKGEEETFFEDRESAEMAVSGAYVLARRAVLENASWAMYSDIRSGLLKLNGPEAEDFNYQQLNSNQALLSQLRDWGRFYKAITQCNVVIEKIPEIREFITADEKKQFVAEAKFLRALLYFNMVRIWGDVPLVTNTEQIDAMPKKAAADVLTTAVDDLNSALNDLPPVYQTPSGEEDKVTTRFRAAKGACYTLLAHIYAWQGIYASTLEAVNNVVGLAQYELHAGGFIQNVFTGNSNENIFGFSAYQGVNDDFEFSESDADIFDQDIYYNGKILPRVQPLSYAAINAMYSGSDVRRSKYFSIDDVAETVEYRKVASSSIISSAFLRYSDVLLLGAEATMESDPAIAQGFLNQVRNRAGLADYDPLEDGELINAVLAERRRELYGEGQDFFDLVRFGKVSEKVANISPADIRDGIIQWPVSLEAFSNNALMTQNPFWN